MLNCIDVADAIALRLAKDIRHLPSGFSTSFEYTCTGNNLSHPLVLGMLANAANKITHVRYVGVDVRLNCGNGIKFQPDIVAYDKKLNPLFMIDHESPNSSDARIPIKDIDSYRRWAAHTRTNLPYIVCTTLPDCNSPSWELRYYSSSGWNYGFAERKKEITNNPFRFWYGHYEREIKLKSSENIALVNINHNQVCRVLPTPRAKRK